MKRLALLLIGAFFCAVTAFAGKPGQVVKVDSVSLTMHWTVQTSGMSKHGMGMGSYAGSSREFTYRLTPQTVFFQGGKKVSAAALHPGMTATVTASQGVASRVDM
jgi:hypothetical protein